MFLKEVQLENVRCLSDVRLSFWDGQAVRKWTFLLGENGTGKSTVLRAIALLLAGSDALADLLGEPDRWVRARAKRCRLRATLLAAEGEERVVRLEIRRGDTLADVIRRNEQSLSALDAAIRQSPRNYLTAGYGVSRRLNAGDATVAFLDTQFRYPRARSVATLFSPDAALNPLETWAMDLHYRRKAAGLRIVREALKDFLPEVDFSRIDARRRELVFRTSDGPMRLGALSDGYQNAVSWCGDLLYRVTEAFQDYRSPLLAPGLLLIDEVDLHLHPVWQRRLRSYLTDKLPNFQMLVTTHSALTAQQAQRNELFVLRREGKQPPTLCEYKGDASLLFVQQLLASEVFGLATLSSLEIERLREEYVELRDKRSRTDVETERLEELTARLRDLPDPHAETAHGRAQTALLQHVESVIKAQEGRAPRGKSARGGGTRPRKA